MKCGVCDGPVRKGHGARVFVAAASSTLGGIRRVIACTKCQKKCIQLALDASPARCDCGKLATSCADCEAERLPKVRAAVVGGAVRRIAGLMRAFPKGNPMHAGLSMAFDVLTSGKWEDEDSEEEVSP